MAGMGTRFRVAGAAIIAAMLSGCLAEVPDNDASQMTVTWCPQIGTDERDFNSICSHFGNETPFSQKPYHRC
jgi:hypothetical protein